MCHNLDVRFDDHWLDTLLTQNEGKRLVERMGASITDYGILSLPVAVICSSLSLLRRRKLKS